MSIYYCQECESYRDNDRAMACVHPFNSSLLICEYCYEKHAEQIQAIIKVVYNYAYYFNLGFYSTLSLYRSHFVVPYCDVAKKRCYNMLLEPKVYDYAINRS